MSPARTWKKNQENSRDHQPFTYIGSSICVESRIMDFKIAFLSVDGPSFLKIEFNVPRQELERKFQRNFKEQNRFTYSSDSVAFECAVVDLHNAFIKINSAALGVTCPPPGHREFSGKLCRPSLIHLPCQRCWCRRSNQG
jgi:hypothetical protein